MISDGARLRLRDEPRLARLGRLCRQAHGLSAGAGRAPKRAQRERAASGPHTFTTCPPSLRASHTFGSPPFSQSMIILLDESQPAASASSSSASSSGWRAALSTVRSSAGACRDAHC